MTLGELYDKLKAIKAAERYVQEAMDALAHGGAPETIQRKTDQLQFEADRLESLRDEEIKL